MKGMGSTCSTHEADEKPVLKLVTRQNLDVFPNRFGSWAQNIFRINVIYLRLQMGSMELSLRSGIVPEKLTAVLLVTESSQNFMEPEGSLPCSQEPTTGPNP
jgi:hypothetical protein